MARVLIVDPQAAVSSVVVSSARTCLDDAEVTVVDALSPTKDAGRYDVVVAGPGLDTHAGLRDLAELQDADPAVAIVLAFDRRPRLSLESVIHAGAVDLLTPDSSPETVEGALTRAAAIAIRRRQSVAPARGKGSVVTVASASGGCGKTFFAVNAAYHFRAVTGGRVCIIDLDLQFGEVVTALRLKPSLTLYDARHRDEAADGSLADHLDDYLVEHSTGIHVLPAPKDPSEADRVDPQDVTRIIEAAREKFDYVVVDTPAALSEAVLAALDLSELLYVMTALDVPSVRNLSVFLHTLNRLKVPAETIRVVMNKAEEGVGMSVAEVEKLIPGGFNAVLPYASVVSRSLNQGVPVLAAFPTIDVSQRLAAALDQIIPSDRRRIATPNPVQARRLPWLFRRRQLQPVGAAR
jgi:pilus assembly protein CpaE